MTGGRTPEQPSEQTERRAGLKFSIAGGCAAAVIGGGTVRQLIGVGEHGDAEILLAAPDDPPASETT